MSEKVKGRNVSAPFGDVYLVGVCDGTYLARALENAAESAATPWISERLYALASRAMRHAAAASTSASARASHLADAEALLKKV